ncbi:MAG: SDR family NAD(P)-dependent oxidoreductase [Candidatus Poribacteria bacterium]|nr:SDR family NAD(P)-dependent oxidoreductase [Candidatus Poribacteria bacterium]
MAFPGFDLTGKVMLVTGAGKGIGRGLAIAAAQMGADVLLNSRTRSDLESVADEIRAAGGKAEPVVFDISNMDEVKRGAQEALDVWGRVDVLVNNAGTNRPKPAVEVTEEDWDAVYDLNLKGLFFLTQTLVKPMIERKKGKIINIASTMGLVGGPLRTIYSGSKGGVVLLTKGLAVEWGPHNVTVNGVAPAFTRTPLANVLLERKEFYDDVVRRIPMGRVGEVDEVVGAVLFLASEAANWITGQTIAVDGGWVSW